MRMTPTGGICPYHKNCLEGFASGPSIEARWGKKAVELVDRPEVWEMESYYIAQALVDYIVLSFPQKIILGGGVMHQEQLFPMIRQKVKEMLNGYIKTKELEDMDSYIVPASLHDDQGNHGMHKAGTQCITGMTSFGGF
ncbi:MAG: ROK family protein [Enterocloster clostridioformis]